MNQKKTMQLWQMLAVVILSGVMLVTMFLPVMHIDGDGYAKAVKLIKGTVEKRSQGIYDLNDFGLDQSNLFWNEIEDFEGTEEEIEEINEKIRKYEEESGAVLLNITPGTVMTHSGTALMGIGSGSSSGSGYTMIQVLFWVMYILAVIIIVVAVMGFAFQWMKAVPLALSGIYGVICAVACGIFQFFGPQMLVNASLGGSGAIPDETSSFLSKLIGCFWGWAFLVAFIIGILLAVVSIASLFTGNEQRQGYITNGSGFEPAPPINPDEEWRRREQFERDLQDKARQEQYERERQAQIEREKQEQLEQQRQMQIQRERQKQMAAAMGQVACIKGVASGQAFSLPEDRKVIVGKSQQNANMIINYPHVSNIHCSIRYKAMTNSYIVKDHSSNGTFVNGTRLQKDVPMEFAAGTVLQLADGNNEIRLG